MARKTKPSFRVGVIGAGGIATITMKSLKLIPGVELIAAADVSEKALAEKKTQFALEATYPDYRDMLRRGDLDGVCVCTPNSLHAPNTLDALQAGCHVIVEKPMAMNARDAQAMVNAAKKAQRKLCIGFQWRYDSKSRYLKAAVDAGQFGDVLYARCQALRRRGIPNWGVFGRKDLQGGGPMIDIGVHIMEVAHFVMGSPQPVSAFGQTWTYLGNDPKAAKTLSMWPQWDTKTYTVEDLAVGQVRFENGSILSIEASFAGHLKDAWNFQVMGTKGGGDWDLTTIYRDDAGYMQDIKPGYLPESNFEHNFLAKLTDWVHHSRDGKPSLISGEQGLMIQKMLDAIYASAEKGGEVKIA